MGEENQPKPIYRVLKSLKKTHEYFLSLVLGTLAHGGIKASIKGVTQVMWTYVKLLHRKEKKI